MIFQRVEELFELERRWSWDPRPWQQRWSEPATLQHVEELLAAAVGVVDQEDVEQRLDRRIDEYWHPNQRPGWRNFEGIRRSICAERDAILQCGFEATPGGSRPVAASELRLQPPAVPHPPWNPFTGRPIKISMEMLDMDGVLRYEEFKQLWDS